MSTVIPEPTTAGSLLLEGPAGLIEAVLDLPASGADGRDVTSPRAVAICCHPHPLFGGALTNKVIHTVARSCAAAGAISLRFNFRGVGRSSGTHDHGRGESEDVLWIVSTMRQRWPGVPLWLAGFSFGAWVALGVARSLAPARLIAVAPPVGRWDFSAVAAPACPWLVVQGERDELVDAGAVRDWVHGLAEPARLVCLPEADHFFHGQLPALRAAVADFLGADDGRVDEPRRM